MQRTAARICGAVGSGPGVLLRHGQRLPRAGPQGPAPHIPHPPLRPLARRRRPHLCTVAGCCHDGTRSAGLRRRPGCRCSWQPGRLLRPRILWRGASATRGVCQRHARLRRRCGDAAKGEEQTSEPAPVARDTSCDCQAMAWSVKLLRGPMSLPFGPLPVCPHLHPSTRAARSRASETRRTHPPPVCLRPAHPPAWRV